MMNEWVGIVLKHEDITEISLEDLGYLEVKDSEDIKTYMKQITKHIKMLGKDIERDCYIFINKNDLSYKKSSVITGEKWGWSGEKITLEEHWAITNMIVKITEEVE